MEQSRIAFELPKEKTFILAEKYYEFLFSLDSNKYQSQIKNHYQPIQALYYDKSGKLISFHANCFAIASSKDTGMLNWDQQQSFSVFPPKSVAPIDSILSLNKHLQFVRTFENHTIDTTGFANYDYTIIIHWQANWRAKDVRNLIEIVNRNSLLADRQKINILYVNIANTPR